MPYIPANSLWKALWSPGCPSARHKAMHWPISIMPSSIHATAPISCENVPLLTASATPFPLLGSVFPYLCVHGLLVSNLVHIAFPKSPVVGMMSIADFVVVHCLLSGWFARWFIMLLSPIGDDLVVGLCLSQVVELWSLCALWYLCMHLPQCPVIVVKSLGFQIHVPSGHWFLLLPPFP